MAELTSSKCCVLLLLGYSPIGLWSGFISVLKLHQRQQGNSKCPRGATSGHTWSVELTYLANSGKIKVFKKASQLTELNHIFFLWLSSLLQSVQLTSDQHQLPSRKLSPSAENSFQSLRSSFLKLLHIQQERNSQLSTQKSKSVNKLPSLIINSFQNSIREDQQQLQAEERGQRDLASLPAIKIIPTAAASQHDKFGLAAGRRAERHRAERAELWCRCCDSSSSTETILQNPTKQNKSRKSESQRRRWRPESRIQTKGRLPQTPAEPACLYSSSGICSGF